MNKDRVEGKAKDLAGRVQRQAGEWTGDGESQVNGGAKQVAGKVQNAWGNARDATQDAADESRSTSKPPHPASHEVETEGSVTTRRSNGCGRKTNPVPDLDRKAPGAASLQPRLSQGFPRQLQDDPEQAYENFP